MERDVEISALTTLRSGFLYLLVAVIVGVIAVVAGLVSIIAAMGFMGAVPHRAAVGLAGILGAAAFLLALVLVAVAIALYAVFGKIRPGMRQLSQVEAGFGICYTGTTLMLVGLLIVALGLIIGIALLASAGAPQAALPGAAFGSLFLVLGALLIGGIIALIGDILTFVVGAFKLHARYQNSLYMVAGVLFVIDIVLMFVGMSGILTLVGYILMYIALGDTINKLATASPTTIQA